MFVPWVLEIYKNFLKLRGKALCYLGLNLPKDKRLLLYYLLGQSYMIFKTLLKRI
jgi:hypothetical protein